VPADDIIRFGKCDFLLLVHTDLTHSLHVSKIMAVVVQNYKFFHLSSSVEFWITGYHITGWLFHADTKDAVLCPFPYFVFTV